MGGQKKPPTFSNITKVGILKEKKSGREVGLLSKTIFFSKNGHAHTQKKWLWEKNQPLSKSGRQKKKVSDKWTRVHFQKVGIPKKNGGNCYVFFEKISAHLPQ